MTLNQLTRKTLNVLMLTKYKCVNKLNSIKYARPR